MILLNKNQYDILIEPLKKVDFNISFVHSIIDNNVSGKVYVDNSKNPQVFYIIHPYGLSLLYGDCNNVEFNNTFKEYVLNFNNDRLTTEWMLAYPSHWHNILNKLFCNSIVNISQSNSSKIEVFTRVNFKFNLQKYLDRKQSEISSRIKIIQTDENIFKNMIGTVIPLYFWDSADDFLKYGIGFSLFYNDTLASTAYSACIQKNKMEIGIETISEFQGNGFAFETCSKLIDYCLKNNYEPIWSCRLENIGSYYLAQKLGFEPTIKLPFYKLQP